MTKLSHPAPTRGSVPTVELQLRKDYVTPLSHCSMMLSIPLDTLPLQLFSPTFEELQGHQHHSQGEGKAVLWPLFI